MKKTIIILSVWTLLGTLLNIVSSCGPCHGEGPIIIKLDSIGSELKIIKEIPPNHQTAYYSIYHYVPKGIGIRYDSLGIMVLIKNKTALIPDESKKGKFFNAAYACDPATTTDKLSSVTITSSADYNDNYPKGTDLQDLMSVHTFYQVKGRSLASLTQNEVSDLFYTFNVPPSENRHHDITIQYTLTDGRIFETTVKNVLIKK